MSTITATQPGRALRLLHRVTDAVCRLAHLTPAPKPRESAITRTPRQYRRALPGEVGNRFNNWDPCPGTGCPPAAFLYRTPGNGHPAYTVGDVINNANKEKVLVCEHGNDPYMALSRIKGVALPYLAPYTHQEQVTIFPRLVRICTDELDAGLILAPHRNG